MVGLTRCLAIGLCLILLGGAAPPGSPYEEGQVWEYHHRPGDEGSLLKVQKIERLEKVGPVYHVSIIGVHFPGLPLDGQIQHMPFAQSALDASVTRLSKSRAQFPDPAAGIAQWKAAQGGVFTLSVADAVSYAEKAIRAQTP